MNPMDLCLMLSRKLDTLYSRMLKNLTSTTSYVYSPDFPSEDVYGEDHKITYILINRDYLKSMRPVSVKTSGYSARGMPTDTGRMKNSMRSRRLKKLAVGVGPSVGGGRRGSKYPFYVHEGTSKMKARPYMKWALEMGAHKVINRTMKNVSNQLRNL